MITKKTLLPLAALLMLPLAGCTGGAQNTDPAGDVPGSSATRTDPGQANDAACTRIGATALSTLADGATDDVLLGYAVQEGDTWYVAAPLGENNVLSDTIGLWTTTGDVESDDFDATYQSANDDAAENSSFTRATDADDDSDAAEQALSCIEDADDTAR
ncbi:hypothetical protein IFT72_11765 [Frigoribacterium sp. CFBP 8754]|uniref:hypothetical protein n=1 Tax=Frigoribacterium sp. CFBP 8754 TaxID=2775290 RepID=UPI001785F8F9|nr:hypothetical protein [Frigoribacterium sp. CFBP 8754]MBD8660858.1 hypothetical protein [Frigoribacterium sp. CFBP 8754]